MAGLKDHLVQRCCASVPARKRACDSDLVQVRLSCAVCQSGPHLQCGDVSLHHRQGIGAAYTELQAWQATVGLHHTQVGLLTTVWIPQVFGHRIWQIYRALALFPRLHTLDRPFRAEHA